MNLTSDELEQITIRNKFDELMIDAVEAVLKGYNHEAIIIIEQLRKLNEQEFDKIKQN